MFHEQKISECYQPSIVKPLTMPLLNISALCGVWHTIACIPFIYDRDDSLNEFKENKMIFSLNETGCLFVQHVLRLKCNDIICKTGKLYTEKKYFHEASKMTVVLQMDPSTCICNNDHRKRLGQSENSDKPNISCLGKSKSAENFESNKETVIVIKTNSDPQNISSLKVKPLLTFRDLKEEKICIYCSLKDEFPFWIFWTDYKNFLIVGSPNGDFMYILSRDKCVSKYELDSLLLYVNRLGYPWNYKIIKY